MKKFYKRPSYRLFFPVLFVILLLMTQTAVRAQFTCGLASSQEGAVNSGLCIACGITSAGNAADNDTTTFSTINRVIGATGYFGQLLRFPATFQAGDSVSLILEVPGQLLSANVLGGIRVESYNGVTAGNDAVTLTPQLANVQLLGGGGNLYRVTFVVSKPFDGISVSVAGGVSLFSSLRIYAARAFVAPPVIASSAVIHASTETSPVITGICVLCSVSNADGAVDGDTTTYSSINAVVGAIGYIGQLLRFNGNFSAGDSVRLILQYPGNLADVQALAGIRIETYTNDVANGSPVFIGGLARITLLGTGGKFAVVFAANHSFNGISVSINGTASALTALRVYDAALTFTSQSSYQVCQGSSVLLQAALPTNATINWYTVATGGTPIATGSSYTTPPLTGTNTYYVEAGRAGCINPRRTAITITASPVPAAPTVTPAIQTVCVGDTFDIVASSSQQVVFNWYTQPSGGSAIFTGDTLRLPATQAGTYYAAASNNGCASASRVAAVVNTSTAPVTVTVTPPSASIPSGGTASFTASSSDASAVYRWYTQPTGGTLVSTGAQFTTPALTSTTNYYLEASSAAGCINTTRVPVTVTVSAAADNVPCDAATTQTSSVNGLCIGCAVISPGLAVDTDTTTASSMNILAGLSGAYTEQVLAFPFAGNAGDTVRIGLHFNAALADVGLLSTLSVASYNGGTYNSDRANVISNLLLIQLLSGSSDAIVSFVPQAAFDRVEIRLNSGVAGVLAQTGIRYATRIKPLATVSPAIPTVCAGQTISMSATGNAGTTFRWYDAATGGTLLFTGNTYATAPLNATTTYYIASVSSTGCENPNRRAVTVTVSATPSAPAVTSSQVSVCNGGTASLSVQSPDAQLTYRWYSTATGGTAVAAGPNFTSGAITTDTAFYVEAASAGGCASSTRTRINVTANATPAAPAAVSNSTAVCVGSTASLSIQNALPGITYHWYTTASGGSSLATGTNFTTPALTTTTTYYAGATNAAGCSSARTAVAVTVNPRPAAPTVTVTPASAEIAAGSTANITVNAPAAGVTYNWYAVGSGGSPLATGTSFTTPALATTTTFYVEAVSAAGCSSVTRTPVTISVQHVINLDCDAPTTNTSSANGLCIGCGVSTGALAVDNDTTTFSQLNMTVALLNANVQQTLIFPQVSEAGDSLTIAFELPPGLLSAAVLGALQIETANGVTANNDAVTLDNTAVRLLYGGNRFSIRYAPAAQFDRVTIRLNSGIVSALGFLRIYYGTRQVTPAVPVNANLRVCPGSTASIAVQPRAGVTINWYAAATGGASLGTGNTFVTPAINTTTTYYAEASRTSNGCVNPTRVPINIMIDPAPAAPAIVSSNVNLCAGTNAVFAVQNVQSNISYRWYDAASGGNLLFTGNTFTASALTSSQQYYVGAANATGCTSASRTPVTATVTTLPVAPIAAGTTTCEGAPAVFTITNSAGGVTYNWYQNATNGTAVGSGTSFTTPSLSSNTTYYAEATNNGCVNAGGRTAVTATVSSRPAIPAVTVQSTTVCNGSNAVINIQNPVGGITYNWYTAASGGASIFTGSTFTTPPVTASVTYFAEAQAAGNCVSASRTPVTLTVVTAPLAPVAQTNNPSSTCSGGSVVLRIQPAGGGINYEWYDAATGGNLLFTGDQFFTPAITTNTTYYVQAVSPEGCAGARTAITVNASAIPATPVISPATASVISGNGAAFTISNPVSGVTYNWYDAPVGGNLVTTGTGYTASNITVNDTLYVEAVNGSQCANTTRQPVFIIIVQTAPAPQVDGAGTVICAGASAMLSVIAPQPGVLYNWYDAATGGTLVYSGTAISTSALNATTSYYVEAVAGGTSSARTQVTVIVTQRPSAPAVTQAIDTTCQGSTATITVASPSNTLQYTWFDAGSGGNQVGTGSSFITPVITAASSYFVQANQGGCPSSVRTRVDIFTEPLPAAPAVVNNSIPVCEGTSVAAQIASPLAGTLYRWYDAATGGNLIGSGGSVDLTVSGGQRIVYAEAINASGCASSSRTPVILTTVTRPAAPVVVVPTSQSCHGTPVTISIQNPDPALQYFWYAAESDESPILTGPSITVSPDADKFYFGAGRNGAGCLSAKTPAQVNVTEALPSPTVMPPTNTATSVTFVWAPVPGAMGYEVSIDGGLTYISVSGTSYTFNNLRPADSVSIWVRATGALTCQTSLSATRVSSTTLNPIGNDVFVPNGFTPNGDGRNDRFRPYGNTLGKAEMWVYSQWGALLYHSEDAIQGWDGTAGGKLQPAGVYVYFLRVTLRDGTITNKKGSVNLIR